MTPQKGQDVYHTPKHGERAARREKGLKKPLENGKVPQDPRMGSIKPLRKHAHRVSRRTIQRWLHEQLDDFIYEAIEFVSLNRNPAPESREFDWMGNKIARTGCTVTVFHGHIVFNK